MLFNYICFCKHLFFNAVIIIRCVFWVDFSLCVVFISLLFILLVTVHLIFSLKTCKTSATITNILPHVFNEKQSDWHTSESILDQL